MKIVRLKIFALASFILVAGLFSGCGSKGPATGSINGQIAHDKKPVTEGNVVFENADRGWAHVAPLDAQGQFQLTGLNPGEYKVTVKPLEPKAPDETSSISGTIPTLPNADPPNIPRNFRSSQSTPLKAVVVEGPNSFNYDQANP